MPSQSVSERCSMTDGLKLTGKQRRFVDEYLVDLNASQAAIRAGYSEKTAGSIGHENLKKPEIQAALTERRKKLAEDTEITPESVLRELAKLGFANMQDYMRSTSDGDPYFDISNISRDQAAALAEVTVEDFKEGRGEDARDVRRIKFKLADKRAALVDIGKHLGMFKERVELTGKDGGAIVHQRSDLSKLSDADLAAIEAIAAKLSEPDRDSSGEGAA